MTLRGIISRECIEVLALTLDEASDSYEVGLEGSNNRRSVPYLFIIQSKCVRVFTLTLINLDLST